MNAEQNNEPNISSSPQSARRFKTILTVCGVGLLVGMIAWVGPIVLWDRLRTIEPGFVVGAMAAIVAGTVLSAVNSYVICGASKVMSFVEYLRAFWIAWAVGLVVPGQVGDLLTLTQVLRRHGMPLSRSVARTGVDKVVSLLCTLFVSSQLFRLGNTVVLRYFSAGAAALLFCVLAVIALSLYALHRAGRSGFTNRWVLGAIATAAEVARTVHTRPRVLLLNLSLSLVKIGLTGVSYWLVIRGLTGSTPSLPNVTIAAISSGLVAYLPLSANGIGTVEMAGTGVFGEIGIGPDVVLSMYVVLRLANMLLAWVPAVFVLPDLLRRRRT